MEDKKKLIIVASNNKHKLKEYEEMLSPLGYKVTSPSELGIASDPDETGKTYRENSYIKALSLAKQCHHSVIADDSGFEVKALDGFPGLHSSRFCESLGGDYQKAGEKLNEMLSEQSDRSARFVCTICYLENEAAEPIYFEGYFEGYLLKKSIGNAGFGYDPFFHSNELNKDMGNATDSEKNSVSHRGKALKSLFNFLQKK